MNKLAIVNFLFQILVKVIDLKRQKKYRTRVKLFELTSFITANLETIRKPHFASVNCMINIHDPTSDLPLKLI